MYLLDQGDRAKPHRPHDSRAPVCGNQNADASFHVRPHPGSRFTRPRALAYGARRSPSRPSSCRLSGRRRSRSREYSDRPLRLRRRARGPAGPRSPMPGRWASPCGSRTPKSTQTSDFLLPPRRPGQAARFPAALRRLRPARPPSPSPTASWRQDADDFGRPNREHDLVHRDDITQREVSPSLRCQRRQPDRSPLSGFEGVRELHPHARDGQVRPTGAGAVTDIPHRPQHAGTGNSRLTTPGLRRVEHQFGPDHAMDRLVASPVAPGDTSIEAQEAGGLGQEPPETSWLWALVADVHEHAERKLPFAHCETTPDIVHRHPRIGCEAVGSKVRGCTQDLGNVHGSIVAPRADRGCGSGTRERSSERGATSARSRLLAESHPWFR